MDMQDKEFDALFRKKLDEIRIEPSDAVWKEISGRLKGKRNNRLVPFISMAASVVILVTAGILFIPRDTNIVKRPSQKGLSKLMQPGKANFTVKIVAGTVKPLKASNTGSAPVFNQIAMFTHGRPVSVSNLKAPQPPLISTTSTIVTAKHDEQPELAAVTQKQPENDNPAISDESASLSIRQQTDEKIVSPTKPLLSATATQTSAVPAKAKHKGHTLGDLINVVIAQIDKRKDKFIEFSDTDDDQSTITGVNIGIIKIKKEK